MSLCFFTKSLCNHLIYEFLSDISTYMCVYRDGSLESKSIYLCKTKTIYYNIKY